MKRRYKVVCVSILSKTVNERFDATEVTKISKIESLAYFDTKERAIAKIRKLIENDELQYEMDHSWGAPPECFAHIPDFEYYIVDREFGKWYSVGEVPDDPDNYMESDSHFELYETPPKEKQLRYVM